VCVCVCHVFTVIALPRYLCSVASDVCQSKMAISVKVDNTGADLKVSITSATTAGDVIEMLTQSPPHIQQRFVLSVTPHVVGTSEIQEIIN